MIGSQNNTGTGPLPQTQSNNCPYCQYHNKISDLDISTLSICRDEDHEYSGSNYNEYWYLRLRKEFVQVGCASLGHYILFYKLHSGVAVGKPIQLDKFPITESLNILSKYKKLKPFI